MRFATGIQNMRSQSVEFACVDLRQSAFSYPTVRHRQRLDQGIFVLHRLLDGQCMHEIPAGMIGILPAQFSEVGKLMSIHGIASGRSGLMPIRNIIGARTEIGDDFTVESHPGMTATAIAIAGTMDIQSPAQFRRETLKDK
uniref:hypothetical protein n=1 Tax=Sphingobium lactosutens TaxID=522773 RepID=UPI0015BD7F90|nr:hypothetical protein [Sphingobium lactosutens]